MPNPTQLGGQFGERQKQKDARPGAVGNDKARAWNEDGGRCAPVLFFRSRRARQSGVAKAVSDSVKEGIIPIEEADDIFICIGVFIHWDAEDNTKIQDWNYEATKLAIKRAVSGWPSAKDIIEQESSAHHPLAAHDY